jgi:hypothetical protein
VQEIRAELDGVQRRIQQVRGENNLVDLRAGSVTQQQLEDLAAAAARAGAQQIDRGAAVTGVLQLDQDLAYQAALAYLDTSGVTGDVTFPDEMTVQVTVQDTTDLQIIPYGSVTVDATATAEAVQGPT